MSRLFQDDLPTSPSASRLRASGALTAGMKSVVVEFGGGEDALKREVGVMHTRLMHGGSWSFYLCPECGRPARVLRLYEKPLCRRCCLARGIPYRIAGGSPDERALARAEFIERLERRLAGKLRHRRGAFELSLRRAQVAAREDVLRMSAHDE
jgi:hypothetical protein